jgi:DNA-binding NarL/FixJ family response regulator
MAHCSLGRSLSGYSEEARHMTVRPIGVLIADDDARVRAALRTFLSADPDFDVVGDADSAENAVAMAREHGPVVALVDILMPAADDGLGLIRTLTGELRIPAVAISMESGVRAVAIGAGAVAFLPKGTAPELLLAALRDAVPSD